MKDLYQILGVPRSADASAIKKAFRKLTSEFHPDRNPDDKIAEERFKDVSMAYEVLGDAERRKNYDEFGDISLSQGFDADKARAYQRSAGGFQGQGASAGGGFGGFNFGSVNDAQSASFDDLISRLFGGSAGAQAGTQANPFGRAGASSRVRRGNDVEGEASITLYEALHGTTVGLRLSGQDGNTRTLDAKIPAGVKDGAKIRFRGQGSPGNPAGDLILGVHIKPSKTLTREGDDLRMRVPISALEAYRGGPIELPIPWGHVTVKLPAGSQSGQVLRLKGKGVRIKGEGKGDLLLVLEVRMPAAGNAELLAALEAAQSEENVREAFHVFDEA